MTHGKYFEELNVGDVFYHSQRRTVTEMDNILFCCLTMNSQPLHIDAEFAKSTQFGRPVVNGNFVLGLVVGLSVSGLSEGTIVANLGFEKVLLPKPVFHGDTISVESYILDKRESKSKNDRGIVHLKHIGYKQDGLVVCECDRHVMFLKVPLAIEETIKSERRRNNEKNQGT